MDKKILFPKTYPYTSSTTKILRDNFFQLRKQVDKYKFLQANDLVIDIGSNDGNLLNNFKSHYKVLGVTPEIIGNLAIKRGIPTIIDYFESYLHAISISALSLAIGGIFMLNTRRIKA